MSSDPLSDFRLNLAAGLTQTLLEAGARRLSQAALGTDEDRALRAALAQGFNALLAEADAQLPPGELRQETLRLVGDIFTEFLSAPEVADNLLAMALAGAPPDIPRLVSEFAALDYDPATLPVDFERCLTAFHRAMTAALVATAIHAGSPLFHQVSLGRTLAIQALLEDQQRSLAAVAEQVRQLEVQGGQVVYNIVIEQAIGPVAIGDQAQVIQALPDDLRRLLQEILATLRRDLATDSATTDNLHLIKRRFAACAEVNLPTSRPGIKGTHFVHPQLTAVETCLATHQPVLLTGSPGVGKSNVATYIARNRMERGNDVLFIDARQIAHLGTPRDLQDFVHLDKSVAESIADIAQVNGCMLIFDQIDSVVGAPVRLLLNLVRDAAKIKGVQVIVVVRQSEDSRPVIDELGRSGFVAIELQPLPAEMAKNLLCDLGINDPGDALLSLATTPLNLDLIARVYSRSPIGAVSSIVTEVGLWQEFFAGIERQESTIEYPDAGRHLRAAAHELAWQCLNAPDREISLRIDSTRAQRRLIEWDILQPVRSGARRFRFRHEQLQDYLIAEDAFSERLDPDQLLQRVNPHRTSGVVDWLTKLYAQSDIRDNVRFLQSYLDPHTSLPFFSQVTILGNYLHRDVSCETPEVIETILGAVQTVTGMRTHFFARIPHPTWAAHLWSHGLYATPPSLQIDAQGRQFLGHWDAQRYLISVAAQAPDIVMRHAMTISSYGWYIRWALEAVCSIPPAMALPITERIVFWFGDPEVAREIDHSAYQLIMRFASAGEADAAFAIFEAMITPCLPSPEQAGEMRMGPDGLALQSDYYELFTNELPQLVQLDFGRLVVVLERNLRALVSFNASPNSYVAGYAFWRSAIGDSDQDSDRIPVDKLLVALRNVLRAGLDAGATSAFATATTTKYLQDEYVIFRRLAIHLIARTPGAFPNELAMLLLDRDYYDDSAIHHEFFQLLRIGFPFLSEAQQVQVVQIIRDGLNQTQRLEVMDILQRDSQIDPSAELARYAECWIRDRLLMLREYLRGEDAQLLHDLVSRHGEPEHPDYQIWHSSATWVQDSSPIAHEQILAMSQDELLNYVETWRPSERTSIVREETRSGLAGAIAAALLPHSADRHETILAVAASDPLFALPFLGRLSNQDDQPTVPWELALLLCEQVVSGQEQKLADDSVWAARRSELRMALLRLLERGLKQDNELPAHFRARVRSILLTLADDPDPTRMDDEPDDGVFSHNDPLSLSLNHVRSRAIALLIEYAVQQANDDLEQGISSQAVDRPDSLRLDEQLRDLLTAKLDVMQEPSWAVRSVYGQYLQTLFWLDATWVTQNLDRILPESDTEVGTRMFVAAWDGFVVSGRYFPSQSLRTLLQPKYLRAVSNLAAGRVTKGLDPAHRLAEHVVFDYLHSEQALATESPDSASLVVVFFEKAPRDSRSRVAWSIWQACIQNPQGFWPRVSVLWQWRVATAAGSAAPSEFADEMTYYAQLPFAVREFVPLSTIADLLKETLRMSGLSDQRGGEWISVEQYLAYRVDYEPREVCDFMSWLIDLAPIPQSTKAIETRCAILEDLAVNQHTRASALNMIDRLARKGFLGCQDIYERHR